MRTIGVRGKAQHARPRAKLRWQIRAGVVMASAAGLMAGLLPLERAQASEPPASVEVATFDYTMPSRFVDGNDADSFPDAFHPRDVCSDPEDANTCTTVGPVNGRPIVPTSWHVDLNACATEGVSYEWTVLGFPALAVTGGPGCDQFDLEVPAEGTYKVGLTVTKADGSKAVGMQEVIVQDFLIISMGDSYGSGEGNPHIEGAVLYEDDTVWGERRCHRAHHAGSPRAAETLENIDPRTSVTFIHLACSGAKAVEGLLEPYDGISGEPEADLMPPVDPQIKVAKSLVGDREIDAVYISIGGNDAYFADIVTACIALDPCDDPSTTYPSFGIVGTVCTAVAALATVIGGPIVGAALGVICGIALDVIIISVTQTAPQLVQAGFVGSGTTGNYATYRMSGIYSDLDTALFATWQSDDVALGLPERHRNRVALSEYVDATKDDDGTYCWVDSALPGVDEAEYMWLDPNVQQELNALITWNANRLGYAMVDGIYDGFQGHGTCADDTYMVGIGTSFWRQQDINGTAHPNEKGHAVYRNEILALWLGQLYPDGQGGEPVITNANYGTAPQAWIEGKLPRKPEQAPVVIPGGAYAVAEGSTVQTTNDSYDDLEGLQYAWSTASAQVASVVAPANAATPLLQGVDDGTTAVTLQVTDAVGNVASAGTTVTVTNVAPTLTSVTVPTTPVLFGQPATATAVFTDPGVLDTHTVTWNWGDGTTSTTAMPGQGTAIGSHTYTAPGLYVVSAFVTDDDGGVSATVQAATLIPVFDPAAGFVTGGGKVPPPPAPTSRSRRCRHGTVRLHHEVPERRHRAEGHHVVQLQARQLLLRRHVVRLDGRGEAQRLRPGHRHGERHRRLPVPAVGRGRWQEAGSPPHEGLGGSHRHGRLRQRLGPGQRQAALADPGEHLHQQVGGATRRSSHVLT
jgi:hypothetical protein